MGELDSKIREFEALSPTEITVDRLRPMMPGYEVIGTMCFPPHSIYRARRASGFPRWNQVQDLSYPKSGSGFDRRADTFVDEAIQREAINSGSSDVGPPASDSSSGSTLG